MKSVKTRLTVPANNSITKNRAWSIGSPVDLTKALPMTRLTERPKR